MNPQESKDSESFIIKQSESNKAILRQAKKHETEVRNIVDQIDSVLSDEEENLINLAETNKMPVPSLHEDTQNTRGVFDSSEPEDQMFVSEEDAIFRQNQELQSYLPQSDHGKYDQYDYTNNDNYNNQGNTVYSNQQQNTYDYSSYTNTNQGNNEGREDTHDLMAELDGLSEDED